MSVKNLNPYINLNGTAGQAIQLYESALGAKTENVMRFSDVPGMEVPPDQKNNVMHAMLRIGESVLMMSDAMPGATVPTAGNVEIALHFDSV